MELPDIQSLHRPHHGSQDVLSSPTPWPHGDKVFAYALRDLCVHHHQHQYPQCYESGWGLLVGRHQPLSAGASGSRIIPPGCPQIACPLVTFCRQRSTQVQPRIRGSVPIHLSPQFPSLLSHAAYHNHLHCQPIGKVMIEAYDISRAREVVCLPFGSVLLDHKCPKFSLRYYKVQLYNIGKY